MIRNWRISYFNPVQQIFESARVNNRRIIYVSYTVEHPKLKSKPHDDKSYRFGENESYLLL